jgi:hypothetical protein
VKKKVLLTTAFISALILLLVSGAIFVNSATANSTLPNYLPRITINGDGSITPETHYINRTGSVYTLTADIIEEYSIYILCNNIVFDGAGHTISVTTADNLSLYLSGAVNVTVKNVEVYSRYNAILLTSCSYCIVTKIENGNNFIMLNYCNSNTITESNTKIGLLKSENNLFLRNNINRLSVDLSSNNNFTQNNIQSYALLVSHNFTNHWDNGSIGNYWSDYLTKHPNASEIGNSGIGDTPYLIDADNVDNYPLMYPYDIEKGTIALPTRATPAPFPTALVIVASVASAGIIAVGLLVYFKKRKH